MTKFFYTWDSLCTTQFWGSLVPTLWIIIHPHPWMFVLESYFVKSSTFLSHRLFFNLSRCGQAYGWMEWIFILTRQTLMKQGSFISVFSRANANKARAIQEYISKYESWSGQSPYKLKSAITFDRDTQPETKQEIYAILDLPHSPYLGKHLGLPLFVGQNKRQVFGEIVEKIGKQISGWKAKTLSQVGSTVSIRSVIASLPIYTMSYFLLPKTRCLWRFGEALRKIRHNWMPKAWRDIYIPIEARGLVYDNCVGH